MNAVDNTLHFCLVISEIFGGVTIATGILGVVVGAEAARRYKKINAKADPLICAVGLLSSAPCMYLAIMMAEKSIVASYVSDQRIHIFNR